MANYAEMKKRASAFAHEGDSIAECAVQEGGPIMQAVDGCEYTFRELVNVFCSLQTKLEPVLLPRPEGVTGNDSHPEPMRSPVADRLCNLKEEMETLISRIHNLSGQVEL